MVTLEEVIGLVTEEMVKGTTLVETEVLTTRLVRALGAPKDATIVVKRVTLLMSVLSRK